MRIGKPTSSPLTLRICFLFMAIVFLSNNVVLPCYEYLKLDTSKFSTKSTSEKKTEKEKEEIDTDDCLPSISKTIAYNGNANKFLERHLNDIHHFYMDILTPPPDLV